VKPREVFNIIACSLVPNYWDCLYPKNADLRDAKGHIVVEEWLRDLENDVSTAA